MYCQNCRTPLKLDGSLESLNPAAFNLLVGSTGKSVPDHGSNSSSKPSYPQERRELYDRVSKQPTSPVYQRSIPPPRQAGRNQANPVRLSRGDSGNMSFVMLTESQVGPPHGGSGTNGDNLSQGNRPTGTYNHSRGVDEGSFADQVERTARLFDIISARSDIDHPICTECTDLLVEGMEKRLADAKKERDAYSSFLRDLKSSIPSAEELDTAQQSLQETLAAEEAAIAELLALEKEKAALDDEIAGLEDESRQLDLEEEKFWRDRNAFALTFAEFQNERDALNMKYDHDSRQLERLQRTNVYNDAFCIGHDGYFGTINGLRLGRLTNPSVDWPEINAAWGQTALLLATIANKLGFQFQGYQIKPMGSMSRIDEIKPSRPSPAQSVIGGGNTAPSVAPKVTTYDLFSSGELPLNLPWLHRRFDSGMVAFLECLRQLGEFVEKTPVPVAPSRRGHATAPVNGLKLPYEIKDGKIGDASIRLGFNQNDETWTRACKYTLTCCKFLLAHASNVASAGSGNSAAVAAAAVAAGEQAANPSSK
ncbi:beclin 1 [Aspergillus homomorphus CBS 101889]|uniref:Autophagy protein Apg6 n=1 Tax=Aspergillus homomorphus (strain CBS 101889) TaxID=1450537 RepID=A0A395HPC5_ASPHC|nr:autophagy protein Apg6 [Aspergillus homomorphus CBS 101889]RAL09812.1 autophagy protein Apg6 [Aspergillus homomorphus CBS 101889]